MDKTKKHKIWKDLFHIFNEFINKQIKTQNTESWQTSNALAL